MEHWSARCWLQLWLLSAVEAKHSCPGVCCFSFIEYICAFHCDMLFFWCCFSLDSRQQSSQTPYSRSIFIRFVLFKIQTNTAKTTGDWYGFVCSWWVTFLYVVCEMWVVNAPQFQNAEFKQLSCGIFKLHSSHWPMLPVSNYVSRFSSRFDEQIPAIVGFAYQEPENDPRHVGYLWVARGPTALQSMYVTHHSARSIYLHSMPGS